MTAIPRNTVVKSPLTRSAQLQVRDDGNGCVGFIVHIDGAPVSPSCGFDYHYCGLFEQLTSIGTGFAGNLYLKGYVVGEITFDRRTVSGYVGEHSWNCALADDTYQAVCAIFRGAAK